MTALCGSGKICDRLTQNATLHVWTHMEPIEELPASYPRTQTKTQASGSLLRSHVILSHQACPVCKSHVHHYEITSAKYNIVQSLGTN
jgi:hypothetical protein